MRLRTFLSKLDETTIVDAIRSIEMGTIGRVRVFVSGRRLLKDDIMYRASRRFKKLGLSGFERQHGILLYFLPLERRFAILAGHSVHECCGEMCWRQLASKIEEFLKQEQFNHAVLHAVQESGKLLIRHFPYR
ncbi:MAG: hypothetical protein C5B47_08400 [Verrucomicrobia bacterium]|nr:MAG: hypothetical protein C5B47_08400 [Verrucomicrobiota bacterium]